MLVSGFERLDVGTLRILGATPDDTGTYVCVASNTAGTDIAQVKLQVQGEILTQQGQTLHNV